MPLINLFYKYEDASPITNGVFTESTSDPDTIQGTWEGGVGPFTVEILTGSQQNSYQSGAFDQTSVSGRTYSYSIATSELADAASAYSASFAKITDSLGQTATFDINQSYSAEPTNLSSTWINISESADSDQTANATLHFNGSSNSYTAKAAAFTGSEGNYIYGETLYAQSIGTNYWKFTSQSFADTNLTNSHTSVHWVITDANGTVYEYTIEPV